MIPNLLKLTHFDKDHPENKNLQITNKRDKYIKVYKNDEWKLNKRDIVIDNILNNKFDTLETYYVEKGKNSIKSYQQQRFEKFQDDIDVDVWVTQRQLVDQIAHFGSVSFIDERLVDGFTFLEIDFLDPIFSDERLKQLSQNGSVGEQAFVAFVV